jgi:ribonuclease-3
MSQLKKYVTPEAVSSRANPKSELQELVQRTGGVVTYRIIDEHGPAHAPSFVAEALLDGIPHGGRATGESKKAAEAAAAALALSELR